MKYLIDKNFLFSEQNDGRRTLLSSFSDVILKLVEHKNSVLVLTEPPASACKVSNLFKIDSNGRELWRAAPSFAAGEKNVFVDIKLDAENSNQLFAWDWDGNRYILDSENGVTIKEEFMK